MKKLHQDCSASYRVRDVRPNVVKPESALVLENKAYGWNLTITGVKSEDTITVLKDRNKVISEDKDFLLNEVKFGDKLIRRSDILKNQKKFYKKLFI